MVQHFQTRSRLERRPTGRSFGPRPEPRAFSRLNERARAHTPIAGHVRDSKHLARKSRFCRASPFLGPILSRIERARPAARAGLSARHSAALRPMTPTERAADRRSNIERVSKAPEREALRRREETPTPHPHRPGVRYPARPRPARPFPSSSGGRCRGTRPHRPHQPRASTTPPARSRRSPTPRWSTSPCAAGSRR